MNLKIPSPVTLRAEPPLRRQAGVRISSDRESASDSIDLLHLIDALRAGWLFILISGLTSFSLVMTWTLFGSMEFRSASRLYVGEADQGGQGSDDLQLSQQLSGLATEVEILRSRSLAAQAVRASGANVEIASPMWAAPKYWRWRLSGRDLNLLDGSHGRLRASAADVLEGAEMHCEFRLRVINNDSFVVVRDGKDHATGKFGVPLRLQNCKFVLNHGRLGAPSEHSEYDVRIFPSDDVAVGILGDLRVSVPQAPNKDVVKVLALSVVRSSPFEAARFLSSLMDVYLEERQAWKTEDASAAEVFVSRQLSELEASLNETQGKISEFRSENRSVTSESEAAAMVEQISKYEEQRVKARLEVKALEEIGKAIADPRAPLESFLFREEEGEVLATLARTLAEERQTLTELEVRFESAAPQVQEQRASVRAQKNRIRRYVEKRLSGQTARLAELNRVIEEYESKLRALPLAELTLEQLDRESEVYSRLFTSLLEKKQQTAIVKASNVSKNRVLDAPRVPRRETSPSLGLRLMSCFLGFFLGAFAILARTLASTKFQTVSEVRSTFPDQIVAGVVPRYVEARSNGEWRSPPIFDVMAPEQTRLPYLEAFRTVRTRLLLQGEKNTGRVLLFTSPQPGDGKTVCTLSLASALAADERKVLVLDGDIRKPTHHQLTGVTSPIGLNEVLKGRAHWHSAVRTVELSRNTFQMITTQHELSAEIFSSVWLSHMISDLRRHYDHVLIDCASYPMISDALLLSRHVDTVISVVRLGNTARRTAEEHIDGLSHVAKRHLILVNDSGTRSPYGISPAVAALPDLIRRIPQQATLPASTAESATLADDQDTL